MKRIRRNVFTVILMMSCAVLVFTSCATSSLDFEEAPLIGMLYDVYGQPVAHAEISLDSGEQTVSSDIDGRFYFPEITRGTHMISVEGNETVPASIAYEFLDRTHVLYIQLTPVQKVLDDVIQMIENGQYTQGLVELDTLSRVNSRRMEQLVLRAIILYKLEDYTHAQEIIDQVSSGISINEVHDFKKLLEEVSN